MSHTRVKHVNLKGGGVLFALLFGGIWTLVTGGFDAFIATSLINQFGAASYPTAKGFVTASEVTRHSGSKGGTTYGVALQYTYAVDGKPYTCDRYAYGDFSSSDHGRAQRIVDSHPVGKEVEVHYNPADPTDATLSAGVERSTLFMLVFMTPFNLIMLGAWGGIIAGIRPRKQAACAGFLRSDDGSRAVLRFSKISVPLAAGIAMLATSFVSIFVVGFGAGFEPSLGTLAGTWMVILGSGVGAIMWRQWRAATGRSTLVLDRVTRRVTLPGRRSTPAYAVQQSDGVPFSDVASIETPADHNRKVNNRSTYQLHVRLKTPGVAEPVVVARWLSEQSAAEAARWLRAEMGLKNLAEAGADPAA